MGGGFGGGGVGGTADGEFEDAEAAVAAAGEEILPTDVFVEAEFVVHPAGCAVVFDHGMEDVHGAAAVAEQIALEGQAEAVGFGGPGRELCFEFETGGAEADARIVNDEGGLHGGGAGGPVEVEGLPLPAVVAAPLLGVGGVGEEEDVEGAFGEGDFAGVVLGGGRGDGPHDGQRGGFALVPTEPRFAADPCGGPEGEARGGSGRGHWKFQI